MKDPQKQTINLQVFADVRQVAALDRFIYQHEIATPRTLSQLGRVLVELLHTVVKDNFPDFEEIQTIEEAIAWMDRRHYSTHQFEHDERQRRRITKALQVQDLRIETLTGARPTDLWEQWKYTHPREAKRLNTEANALLQRLTDDGQKFEEAMSHVQQYIEKRKRELMNTEEQHES